MLPHHPHTDEQLISLLKTGDEVAFTEIYNRYWEKLFYVAHKRLQSAEDAKEIVQNIFLTLWQKKEILQIQSLELYLAAMVRYAVYRHWANACRKESVLRMVHPVTVVDTIDFENKQILDLLTRFADTLPKNYRLVFISHKMLDRPLEEVAEQLGVSPRTAEGYVSKVMEIMRRHHEKIAFSLALGFFF